MVETENKEKSSLDFTKSNAHVEDEVVHGEMPHYDRTETRRILRKMDARLMPVLAFPYLMSFLDRSNIGNAKVAGMAVDMGLSDKQYNICLMVFFFTYSLFEVPSNILLKLVRPSWWITILMVSWGTIMTLQGLVKNYHHLIVTRTLLGLAEAGFFPAASYLLTTWYCRFELQTRLGIFFSAASLAGAFSGLLAYGISKMEGVAGLEGWRWIFILEGMITVIIGLFIPLLLPDSPDRAKFLNEDEKAFIKLRLQHDSGTTSGTVATNEKFQWKFLRGALLDWKIYLAVFMYWGNSIPMYALSFAAPTIIKGLGYSAANAQLLTVPVYFMGVFTTIAVSIAADRYKTRWLFILGPFCFALIGFIGVVAIPHPRYPGVTYAMLFFMTGGCYPALIGVISWIANNLAPSWKRAVGMALLLTFGNLGGVIGSNIFLARQAPKYALGYGMSLALVITAIFACLAMRSVLLHINKKRDQMPEEEVRAKYTEEQLLEMGDESPLFRYVI